MAVLLVLIYLKHLHVILLIAKYLDGVLLELVLMVNKPKQGLLLNNLYMVEQLVLILLKVYLVEVVLIVKYLHGELGEHVILQLV
jgi:hypothetical protein